MSVLLCILDGWGVSDKNDHNPINQYAKHFNNLKEKYSYTTLEASKSYVGLPDHQMGNSEVGHMTMGLGRVIYQDLVKINKEFQTGRIQEHLALKNALNEAKQSKASVHLMGLLSDGGVHSHEEHLHHILDFLLPEIPVCFHAFLDGRDTPPQSAKIYLKKLLDRYGNNPHFQLSTLSGRYYSMDRDQRWDRTKQFIAAVKEKRGDSFDNGIDYIDKNYTNDCFDEFIKPAFNKAYKGIGSHDVLWMANFRADRVRQSLKLLLEEGCYYKAFGFHSYSEEFKGVIEPLLTKEDTSVTLGSIISQNKMRQLRIAETEKYAHVTFFFNGGREAPYEDEYRLLIPSPKVATYDLKPEMSANEICSELENILQNNSYDLIVANFANADMVGHTGNEQATIKAIETLDACLKKLSDLSIQKEIIMIITADHGNAEEMYDHKNNQPHTAHTTNKVPFLVIDKISYNLESGTLASIAPTILKMLNLPKGAEMNNPLF